MEDNILDRNKNINRGFRKLQVWREVVEFYVFVQKKLDNKHYSLENKMIALNRSQIKYLKEKGSWNDDYILREDEISYE